MALIDPDHLLDHAFQFAVPGIRPRRETDLKRAISNAYYAVFHSVAAAAADEIAGELNRDSPLYALAYRSINHKALASLCADLMKPTLPRKYAAYEPNDGFGSDLIALATALTDLQERRHAADYDPLSRVSTSDVFLAVSTARTALSRFKSASRARRKAFVFLLVFSPR